MGTVTILVEEAWELVAAAEAVLFEGEAGCFPYTEVNARETSALAAELWDHAGISEDSDEEECAKRVAVALTVLAFGSEFLDGKLELLENATLEPHPDV